MYLEPARVGPSQCAGRIRPQTAEVKEKGALTFAALRTGKMSSGCGSQARVYSRWWDTWNTLCVLSCFFWP